MASILQRLVSLVETGIERLGSPRADLERNLKLSTEANARLVEDRRRMTERIDELQGQVDSLRFNGPTLYSDEVDLLQRTAMDLVRRANPELDHHEIELRLSVIRALLDRCDLAPFTHDTLEQNVRDAYDSLKKNEVLDVES